MRTSWVLSRSADILRLTYFEETAMVWQWDVPEFTDTGTLNTDHETLTEILEEFEDIKQRHR